MREFRVKESGMMTTSCRRMTIELEIDCIGTKKETIDFYEFAKSRLVTILKNYAMDWHVKPEAGEQIEFIMNVMGKILNLQEKGKMKEAQALFDLVDKVLPEYQHSPSYQTAEALRNMIMDKFLTIKHEKGKV